MRSHPPRARHTFAGFVLLLVVGLLLLPEVVRHLTLRHLEARVTTKVRIGDVDMNPFTGRARVSNLVIADTDGSQPILRLPRLDLGVSRQSLLQGKLAIRFLTLHRPQLFIERIGPDLFNFHKILRPGEGLRKGPGSFTTEHIEIEGGEVTFVDRTTTPAATSALRDVQLAVEGLDLTPNAVPGRLKGKALLGKAPIRISGTLRPHPFATHVMLTATDVRLQTLQDHIDAMLGTTNAVGGAMNGRLEIALTRRQDGRFNLKIGGTVEGRNVDLWLPGEKEPLLSAAQVAIDLGRTSRTSAPQIEIARIELLRATLRLKRDREGNLNLRRLWGSPQGQERTPTPKPAARNPADPPTRIAIRRLDVAQSRIEFMDATVTPAFNSTLSDLTAEVRYPAPRTGRASLKVQGALGDSAQLQFNGWFTPSGRPLGLQLEGILEDFEVSRLNSYAEKYIGYRFRRGRVTTEGKYRYSSGNLGSTNNFTFRKVQLGKKVGPQFQKRVGIPLNLALALLEDVNGDIRLRIPVRGNLDNPKFSLESVIWKGFRKALFKVLTAPLHLLGKIVTVGGKIGKVRIKPIGFLPGSLEPNPDGRRQLEKLINFLRNKPKVELQVLGRATPHEVKALRKRQSRGKAVTMQMLHKLAEDRSRLIERILVRRGVKPKRLFILTGDRRSVTDAAPGRVEFDLLH